MTGDTWGCCIMAHLRSMEIERIDVAYQGNQVSVIELTFAPLEPFPSFSKLLQF